ncbi:hypothetical protein CHUAL_005229 [Chamberlinius hualienensis]
MKTAIILCCLAAVALAVKDPDWETFKVKFNRSYISATEEAFRKKIFLNNKKIIDQHNQRFDEGKTTFKMGINQFADLTTQEYTSMFNGVKAPADFKTNKKLGKPLPQATAVDVDWRTSGCVPAVRDQGQCGSCWSFSAIESIEFCNCMKGSGSTVLSEQNLVDCTYAYGNLGCNGGWMDSAFQYVIDNNGVDTEASYPYEAAGVAANCRFNPNTVGGKLINFVDLPYGDEAALADACAQHGVVSVAIDASHVSFQLYASGIYSEPLCDPDYLDHAVLVVGYGADFGSDYWIVENSWGTSWGMAGYINMSRNQNNQCGIASAASYVTC